MNYSQLPRDVRKIILKYVQEERKRRPLKYLNSELDRWQELGAILCHTILNGPGGNFVHRKVIDWSSERIVEVCLEIAALKKSKEIDLLLLKCKPSSNAPTVSIPRASTRASSTVPSASPAAPKAATPACSNDGTKESAATTVN